MKIVGHKSEKMHRRYNSVNEDDLLRAIAKINTVITPAVSTDSTTVVSYWKIGAGEEIRTPDQRLGKRLEPATPDHTNTEQATKPREW